MATTFTGLRVQDTYNAILKIGDNSNLSGTAKILSDGVGNSSSIYLSTTRFGIGITPAYQFHTSGNAKIGGNLIISGDLTVNGSTTIIDSTIIAIGDNMIEMAKDNVANTKDIGWYGTIVESGTKYAGMAYDASTGVTAPKFNLGLGTVEPGNTFATTVTGTLIANLEGNVTGGTISGTTGSFSGLVSGIAPTSDLNFATKKYVDDQTIPTPTLSSVLSAGNSSGANDLEIIDDQKLLLGDDGDMQIYHNQVNSVFFNDTGNIVFRNNANDSDISFQTDDGLGYTTEYLRIDGGTENIVFSKPISGTTASFSGLVTGIAPTSDLNFATKKYVDDQTVPTPTLSSVLGAGNTSGANDIIMADNQKILVGTDSDLELWFSSADGYFRNNTGDLYIQNFADDKSIVFQSDNGIGGVTEYFKIDGNINRNVILVTTQLNDNVPMIFGDGVGRPSIKYDSTASQLFIGGQIKFLDDIYVIGKANLNDADIDDTLAFHVSSTDAARQRADARDDDTTFARLHWFGTSDDGSTSNFRHAYYDGTAYINVTAQNNIVTYTGALKSAPASGDGILFLQSTSQTARIDQNSLRTTTNSQFTFMTNSLNALQLDTSQNSIFFANLYMPQYLKHSGDENTYLQFQDDRQTLVAGGSEFIDFANTTQDYLTLGNANDTDVKIQGGNGIIFIDGSNNYIGINDLSPDYAFDVNAETRFGLAVNFDNTRYNKGGSSTLWYASTTNARINFDARVDGTGVVIHKWNRNANDDAYLSYAENWYDGNSYHKISAYNNGFMLNGNIRFESYGAGNITGTLSRLVGFEANGGLIDVPLSAFIDGSGVAGRIPYFTDASSLTSSSLFFENSDKIRHLQTIGPNDDVRKGFCVEDQTAMAAGVGGQLTFRYMYTTEGAITEGAMIRTYKLNSTSADYSSGLKFQVRNTGDDLSTKMTLNPSGFLGLGTTTPNYHLDIESSGAAQMRLHAGVNQTASLRLKNDAQDWDLNTQTNDTFAIFNQTLGTQPFSILPNGYIGIGVASGMTSLLNFAANQNAANAGADNWSGSAINTFGGDLATGRLFLQGYQQTGNDIIGLNVETSDRAVLYNYTDNRYLQIWNDNGNVQIPSGSLTITSTISPLLVLNPTANNYGGIQFNYGGAVKGVGMYNSGMMVFGGESGTITRLQANGQYGLTVLTNLNVGIGDTNPTYKLDILDSTPYLRIKGTGIGEFGLKIDDGGTTGVGGLTYNSSTGEQKLNGGKSYVYQTMYAGGSERMRLTTTGYLLINRTANATNQPLQVEGFIDITKVDDSALRIYNGSTFRGGFGMTTWGVGTSVALTYNDMVCYAVGNLDFVTGGTSFAAVRVNSNYNLIVTGGVHAFNGDSSYGGISINVPSGTKKYLGFFDSGTTNYGGGIWYDEASNITSLYSLLGGTQTQHVQLDRATGNTWINPSGGKVTIGVGSTQSEMLHIRSTSGDADILLHSSNGQKLRLDSNSIRTTTASNLAIFVNNDTAKGIYLDSSGQVRIGTTSASPNFMPGPPKLYVVGNSAFQSPIGASDNVRSGLAHYDSTAGWGAGIGGQIVLGYIYSGSAYTEGAIIRMYKTNSTQGDYSSGLKFQVRNNGASLSTKMTLNAGGDLSVVGSMTAAGDVIAFSDKRVKTNIKTINNGLEKISKLRGVSYNRTDIDDKSDKIGVIAQEVKKVLPEVVIHNEDDDKYGVDYGKMAGVFIEAIKELKAELDSLKQELKQLKK
jgi:hypothetical protein